MDRRPVVLKGVKRIKLCRDMGIGRRDTVPSVCVTVLSSLCAQALMRESMHQQACRADICSSRRSGEVLFARKVRGQNTVLRFVNRRRNYSEILPEHATEVRRTRKAP